MKTLEYNVYTLMSSHIPEVKHNQIIKGLNYGGIKLNYSIQTIFYKEIKIGKYRILLPIKYFKKKKVTFLKMFKQFWSVRKNRLTPNDWGKKKSPYLDIWCELTNGNYDDFSVAIKTNTAVRTIHSKSIDKNLVYCLNKQSKKFKIKSNNLIN